jgi:hypothetical protein
VRLVNARIGRRDDWSGLKSPLKLDFHYESGDAKVAGDQAEIRTDFRFRAMDSSASQQEALLVECSFLATYAIEPSYKPSESELNAFQAGNAIFNAWPYFREFVQTNIARMSLPIPPVPFLRLIPKATTEADVSKKRPSKKKRRKGE